MLNPLYKFDNAVWRSKENKHFRFSLTEPFNSQDLTVKSPHQLLQISL